MYSFDLRMNYISVLTNEIFDFWEGILQNEGVWLKMYSLLLQSIQIWINWSQLIEYYWIHNENEVDERKWKFCNWKWVFYASALKSHVFFKNTFKEIGDWESNWNLNVLVIVWRKRANIYLIFITYNYFAFGF